MRRIAAAVVGVLAVWSGSASAGDGPPPVTPPVLTAPVAEPPGELPPALDAAPLPGRGPVLVVPGVTSPRPGARARRPAAPESLPPLVGPAEMLPAPTPAPSRAGGTPPLTLESIPAPTDDDAPTAVDAPRRAPAPRRPPGLFGRFFPQPPGDRNGAGLRGAVTVEPRTDPAADAAAKRRIERQIRDSLGGKVRSAEVRVVGREVTIRAQAARFWQRRAVRTALESLPALSGYKVHVEVGDGR